MKDLHVKPVVTQVLPFACQISQSTLLSCLNQAEQGLAPLKQVIEATLPQPHAGVLRWAFVSSLVCSGKVMLQCEGVYLAC